MEVDQPCSNNDFNPMQSVLSEVASFCQPYVQKLYDSDKTTVIEGLKEIKNLIIGNNKQKSNFIVFGVIRRLLYLIEQNESDIDLKVHCAVILGSLAKGINTNITNLLDCGVLGVMYSGLQQADLRLYEACIRCVRTIVTSPNNEELLFCDPSIIPVLLSSINRTMCIQECTCEIIAHCCKTTQQQNMFYEMNAIPCVAGLLASTVNRVKVKTLKALSVLCYKNKIICQSLLNATVNETSVSDILISMLSRAEPTEIQINAAKCLTYAYRSGASTFDKGVVYKKVLPCLVRMCDASRNIDERVTGASTIAYLIEFEPELQRIALICEQFPSKLASYFLHPSPGNTNSAADMRRFNYELSRANDLHEAVFMAYASLLSNDEDMRNLVVTETLVTHVVASLENASESVRVATLHCLLSLSRSVQILRTAFEDLKVWQILLKVLRKEGVSEKELVVGSALFCNLILDFSPCKDSLVEENVLKMLKDWCSNDAIIDLKRNGIWGFLNLTFQAMISLKMRVMKLLDQDTIFMLLSTNDHEVVLKTLGVLRNVLATTQDVDAIMEVYGDTIMQACVVVLESPSCDDVADVVVMHTLCILDCVAAGDEDKTILRFLHDKENILQKMIDSLASFDDELRRAAVDCLWKLSTGSAPTVVERRSKFREMGVVDKLQQRIATSDAGPSERIKEILTHLQT